MTNPPKDECTRPGSSCRALAARCILQTDTLREDGRGAREGRVGRTAVEVSDFDPVRELQSIGAGAVSERSVFPIWMVWRYLGRNGVTYHFTVPPPPKLGFCLSLGLARWAARDGAEGPMREYSSREMPSGFFAAVGWDLRVWDVDWGSDSALRTSDAETAMRENRLLT